ncbi:hypothetical protein BGZ98_009461 [Dissophora globulifera]|nr:hypothetical protein BGZ98_009461 [Dissophora globulifera]
MRFSALAVLAAVVAVANAQTDAYPFKPNGPCVAKCLLDVGKTMYPDFTDDPTNAHFLESLGYAHDKGTPKYITYMTNTGMCIGSCPKEELDLYNSQYQAKADWYASKKGTTTSPTAAASPSSKPSGASMVVGSSAFVGLVSIVMGAVALL